MKHFYFTNPTRDRVKGRQIQMLIEKELKGLLKLSNPFYGHDGTPTKEIAQLDRGEVPDVSEGEIIHNDLKLIRDLDGTVAWVTSGTSWGSISETFFSSYQLGKPTYIIFDELTQGKCSVCQGSNPNNPKHPWPRGNSTRYFGNLQAFIEFAKGAWGNDDKKV